jgi:N-acetylated-alpha-linked acidic dipeptidase
VSLSATTDAASLRRVANQLGATPRVSGTPGAALAAGLIADEMRAAGLRVEVHEYEVWLPHARTVTVERLGAGPKVAAVALEPNRVVSAAATGHDPVAAGYSAAGEAVAPLVYANYGRPVDFAELRRAGVAVAGRIALIRYGGVFRGDKVRNAEAAGAVAVILYSDPEDDGYVRGAVYPDGPFRPPDAVQRGSVKVGAPGDPASPGRAALVGEAHRAPVEGLPTIPVVALGYAAAAELMEGVGGRVAPIAWQGGLPMPYNYGGSGSAVRVRVEMEGRPWRRIRNVVGTLEGARRPDEWVILGAHYDSWTHGAIDNVSGTAAMLETARVLGAQAAMGNRSDRSLLFAAWDAEEWGLVGSTEWVEEHSRQLRDGAVAYVNLDGIAGGPYFSAVASPSLRPLLLEGADAVADPVLPNTSVYRAWRGRIPNGEVGLPGGGSDYAAFASIAGVPSIGFGFSAAAGVYHSAYDTIEFMERFGDPGYRQHRSTAALATWLLWRLGNDRTPAFDYTVLAQDVVNGLSAVRRELRLRGREDGVAGWSRAWSAVGAFALAARELEGRLAAGESAQANAATLALANAHLRRAHRQLAQVRDAGVWSRSVLVAPDPQNTYRSLLLPAVAAGLRGADMRATIVALTDLAAGMEAATAELAAAERALQPARRNGVVAGR